MSKYARLLLTLIGATVMLGALVGTASANRLSTSNRNIRATWARMTFSGGFGDVVCPVTLEGSLHSAVMTKVLHALIGHISRGTVASGSCTSGRATILQASLPWHVTYEGFIGALPNITALRTLVIGAGFQIQEPTFGVTCLARTEVGRPAYGTYNRNTATGALTSVDVSGTIPCSGFTGTLSGRSSTVTLLGTNTAVTITLI